MFSRGIKQIYDYCKEPKTTIHELAANNYTSIQINTINDYINLHYKTPFISHINGYTIKTYIINGEFNIRVYNNLKKIYKTRKIKDIFGYAIGSIMTPYIIILVPAADCNPNRIHYSSCIIYDFITNTYEYVWDAPFGDAGNPVFTIVNNTWIVHFQDVHYTYKLIKKLDEWFLETFYIGGEIICNNKIYALMGDTSKKHVLIPEAIQNSLEIYLGSPPPFVYLTETDIDIANNKSINLDSLRMYYDGLPKLYTINNYIIQSGINKILIYKNSISNLYYSFPSNMSTCVVHIDKKGYVYTFNSLPDKVGLIYKYCITIHKISKKIIKKYYLANLCNTLKLHEINFINRFSLFTNKSLVLYDELMKRIKLIKYSTLRRGFDNSIHNCIKDELYEIASEAQY